MTGSVSQMYSEGSLLVAGTTSGAVRSWQIKDDGEAVPGLSVQAGAPITSVALYLVDVIAAGDASGVVSLWGVADTHAVVKFHHAGPVTGVQFAANGLVSASGDGTVRRWDFEPHRAH